MVLSREILLDRRREVRFAIHCIFLELKSCMTGNVQSLHSYGVLVGNNVWEVGELGTAFWVYPVADSGGFDVYLRPFSP